MLSMDNLTNNKGVMLGLAVLAFLVAAVLVIMIFRMLFSGRLRMPGGRARQARLGIVDAFDLDRQRQLIIVRRDNTEHLIMIGGPNDVVIESEIVRAESRELRDQRREPVSADGRIPAPAPAFDKPAPEKAAFTRSNEEPKLSLPPLSEPRTAEARADLSADAPRTPTFPLPARRPVSTPTSAPAERRAPVPPKLPESVARGDDLPAFSGQPAAPAPPAPIVPPPVAAARPAPAPPSPPPAPGQTAAPGASARPPFLKPLPARPPVRPLPPRPNAPAASGGGSAPAAPSRTAPPTAPRSDSGDALESLEEEMAKLLGRGS